MQTWTQLGCDKVESSRFSLQLCKVTRAFISAKHLRKTCLISISTPSSLFSPSPSSNLAYNLHFIMPYHLFLGCSPDCIGAALIADLIACLHTASRSEKWTFLDL